MRCHIYRLSQIPKSSALAGVRAGSWGRTAPCRERGWGGGREIPPQCPSRCLGKAPAAAWPCGGRGSGQEVRGVTKEQQEGKKRYRGPGRLGCPTGGGRRRGWRSGLRGRARSRARAARGSRRCPGPSARRGRGAGAAPRAPAPRQLRTGRGTGGARGGGRRARGGGRALGAGQDGAGRPAELLAAPRVEQRVEGRERAEQQPAGGLQRRRRRAQEEAQEAHPDQGLGAQ